MLFRLFHVKEHTLSVFQLVCQYVDIGFFACDSVVAIGMIPLLLQSLGKGDYIPLAVFCFTKIISYDVGPLAAIIRDSAPTLLEELCHPDNNNKTACILFILSRIFTDPNTFHHSEARALDEHIISLLCSNNTTVIVWTLVYLKTVTVHITQKPPVYVTPNFFQVILSLARNASPLVRAALVSLLISTVLPKTDERSAEFFAFVDPFITLFSADGCATVRCMLLALLFTLLENGHKLTPSHLAIIDGLTLDTNPDVTSCADSLASTIRKLRPDHPSTTKSHASLQEKHLSQSRNVFVEVSARFSDILVESFRSPLLTHVVHENVVERHPWFDVLCNAARITSQRSQPATLSLNDRERLTYLPATHHTHTFSKLRRSIPIAIVGTPCCEVTHQFDGHIDIRRQPQQKTNELETGATQQDDANNTTVPVNFVQSKFGTDLPVIDDFLFYPKDSTRSRFYCRTRSCKASVIITKGSDGVFHADRFPTHNHPNHNEYTSALKHIQRLREEAKKGVNRHVSSSKVTSAVRLETKTARRRSVDCRLIRRYRKRGNAPRTPAEIETFPFLEQNAIYIHPDKSIIIFARDWSLRVASTVRRICVDGTFRAAPVTHYQLLTFHALCSNGSSFPIIHALMANKRCESYLVVLQQIEQRARAMNLRPVFCRTDVVVSVDYENALIKAFRTLGVALHGCYFHLCQAVWRFVKSHAMAVRYNTETDFRKHVRSLTALVFLPPGDVPKHFNHMLQLVEEDTQLVDVYRYFEQTWINGFGIELISQYEEVFRTNNCAESFHNSLRMVFPSPRPNFYDFVERLSEIMDHAENEFNVERVNPKRMKTKVVTTNAKIKQLVEIFNAKDVLTLELPDLLGRIGSLINETYNFESRYEDVPESALEYVDYDFCEQGEVPMELDGCQDA